MAKTNKPKKKRWYSYLADAYRVSKKTYPWTGWAVWGTLLGILALFIILAIITSSWFFYIFVGVVLATTLAMLVLLQLVKSASYKQIDGMPGAASAVLGNIKRGWNITEEPVRFNPRSQDMVFRAIGRPGIVLIGDGSPTQVNKLIDEERRAIKRVAPSAPVQVITVGNSEGQVKLSQLEKAMRRLPKKISNQEVAAVAQRLRAIPTNALPIPKGIDPMNARPNRKAMRGR
ncbi:DUF4191 domain-containing protein [Arcanobacterium canis]